MAEKLSMIIVSILVLLKLFSKEVVADDPKPSISQLPRNTCGRRPTILNVVYPGGSVKFNSVVSAGDTRNEPQVTWRAKRKYYTLILTNFGTDKWPQLNHWLVVNIPGNDISRGKTLYEYIPSAPLESTGIHPYVFHLYEQGRRLNECEYSSLLDPRHGNLQTRMENNIKDIVEVLNISRFCLVGLNRFYSIYDESVNNNIIYIANKYV